MDRSLALAALSLLLVAGTALPSVARAQPVAAPPPAPLPSARPPAVPALLSADRLPLTRVVLYRSGVGYFERAGLVDGATKVQLTFDVNQINDVLKSLQAVDAGGRVETVSYASKEPLARRLSSFALQIGDNPSLASLFDRLRGSTVVLELPEGSVTGTVLSVESRLIPSPASPQAAPVETKVLNLVTAKGIRSIPIPTISTFQLQDQRLADDLARALQALAESRAERSKTVDVVFNGDARRPVAVAYVHETPVWKTSYRLILPDAADPKAAAPSAPAPANPPAAAGKGVLQGWAIVENTTDTDWTNIRLALVSGRPVSFRMDLYSPLFMFRPEVPVPAIAGVTSRQYDGGVEGGKKSEPAAAAAAPSADARARREAPGAPASLSEMAATGDSSVNFDRRAYLDATRLGLGSTAAMEPRATGSDVGEQFQFQLDTPVTIERQRSAMIPILAASIEATRVSIYNMNDRADHPMRGVRLVNPRPDDGGQQLLPGPISVFDGAAYAGDAQIGQVPPGDTRLLAFAVDLDVAVLTESVNQHDIQRVRLVEGSFDLSILQRQGAKYTFRNKDLKRPRTIVLEHPLSQGWTLKEPAKPAERTQNLYRFEVPVASDAAATLSVIEEHTERQVVGINDYELSTVLRWSQEGKVSQAVVEAVREVGRRQAAVAGAERQVASIDAQLQSLRADQSRISAMLQPLDRTTDTYSNLIKKLNRQEAEIDKLQSERAQAAANVERLRGELAAFLRQLTVE